ncbi:MAG TPA: PBP1A family penicillin-binding protein [Patescibacteria group bacterium]|nr:PBP1A family penicillin-binding protein [Patescibacteria group bacterium]
MPIKPDPPTEPAPPPFSAPVAAPVARKKRHWIRLVVGAFLLLTILLGATAGYLINADLPDIRSLEDYQPPTITQILAQDGRVVHQFAEQKRIVVPLTKISPMIQNAVIAVEDANFKKHVGVDPSALFRAAVRDVIARRWAQGGSTLTQQLTKILFLRPDKHLRRKLQEALLALEIEKTYTKDEILEFYLNQIYLGHGRYGMEAASQFYFGVPAAEVRLEQAALLAGLIQRPEDYSPVRSPTRAASRRNHVLDRMVIEGYISAEQAAQAKQRAVVTAQTRDGESVAPYFAEEIRKVLAPRYGDEALLREGLAIRTGIDLDLQNAANKALSKGLRDLDKRRGFRRPEHNIVLEKLGTLETYQHPEWNLVPRPGDLVHGLVMKVSSHTATIRLGKYAATLSPADAEWTGRSDLSLILRPGDLALFEVRSVEGRSVLLALDQEPEVEGALLALDPRTGDIRAMAGGYDFNRSQFNRSTQAQRQCGSAFKPFIYAAAIEDGRTPSDLLFDEPTIFVDPSTRGAYQPENYERRYEGVVTLRKALEESLNIPTIQLLNQIGYTRTVEFARRLGVTSKLYPYPSLGLGTSEVSLMELTAAYGVFPTGGILSTPRYFSEVRDREGNVLEETRNESREVLKSDVAAVMVSLMQGVLQRGTAAAGNRPDAAIAGKTGTTDDYTDAWFIGYSPSLVLGVWVGHDKKLSLGPKETGARAALPIWSEVMDTWLAAHPKEAFPVSDGVVSIPVDRDTGLRAVSELGCRKVITETFVKGSEIERPCTANAHMRLSLPYFLQRYPMREEGRIEISDGELDRLIRENPFHLDLLGNTSLNVLTPSGVQVVRLSREGGHAGSDVTWGFFRRRERPDDDKNASPEDAEADELAWTQFLPVDLPPLGAGPHQFVGIDGRTAAVIPIRSN